MRAAPVALPHLDDPEAVANAARKVGALTHYDHRAQEACVLWSLAIRHAVLHAEFDIRAGLVHLDTDAAAYWTEKLDEAETSQPGRFRPNGWAVTALQAAWSAILHTPVPTEEPCRHLVDSLTTAIAIGDDTDTVAAIAGGLLGARWGASAVPADWRRISHGYPGITGERLVELAHLAANKGPTAYNWPLTHYIDYSTYITEQTIVTHPYDDGVYLADASALDNLPDDVTAVVSLCLVGTDQIPRNIEHVVFRLIDVSAPDANPNLDFMITDTARTVATLRDEGHIVLVHCVAAQSRTPTAAIAYALRRGVPLHEATRAVVAALPRAHPNSGFREALTRLAASGIRA